MATVELPGGPTLSYREWGRPDGAVVLMLHGLRGSGETWRHVGAVLGEHFRVIAPDARGHGDSEWTKTYSMDELTDDVVRLMDEIGVLAAIVVGHSMGALTAYQLAATQPERIRLLVLEDMPPPDPADPPRLFPSAPDPAAKTDWHAVIAFGRFRNAPDRGWWDYAGQIQAKTLVLGGARSGVNQQRLAAVAEAIPNGTFTSVDLGHDIHTEQPSQFLQVVEPFIAWFAK